MDKSAYDVFDFNSNSFKNNEVSIKSRASCHSNFTNSMLVLCGCIKHKTDKKIILLQYDSVIQKKQEQMWIERGFRI